jgi:hyperosmotically inducible periplasmic protein
VKTLGMILMLASFPAVVSLSGCSNSPNKAPDVADQIRQNLDQAGLKDVGVSQDRDKGVITLSGNVNTDADRSQAESIAKAAAGSEVVSDQIGVRPPGSESDARKEDSAMDSAIGKNLDAVLIQHKLQHDVSYDVKNGVVTLKGKVNSENRRAMVEKLAAGVPDVKQVVNELEIKNHKATSSD